MNLAFIIVKDCNERIEDVLWSMPIQTVFKLIALSYQYNSGKKVMTYRDKHISNKMLELVEGLDNE